MDTTFILVLIASLIAYIFMLLIISRIIKEIKLRIITSIVNTVLFAIYFVSAGSCALFFLLFASDGGMPTPKIKFILIGLTYLITFICSIPMFILANGAIFIIRSYFVKRNSKNKPCLSRQTNI